MSLHDSEHALPAPPTLAPLRLREVRARGRVRGKLALLGPAFVAAVAYVDPGNFATNIAGGAKYGFLLVWVLISANLMAMLVQYLSAKVGIVTGRNLPELCREHFPRPVTWGLWAQAEVVAIATDLAEFVGAAVALNLLFGVPPFAAGLLRPSWRSPCSRCRRAATAASSSRSRACSASCCSASCTTCFRWTSTPPPSRAASSRASTAPAAILLAVGIIGATVMPHVVYLHSALTQRRVTTVDDDERRELVRFQRVDVVIALGLAGLINLTMLVVAAALFNESGLTGVETLEGAHAGFEQLLGGGAALAFAVALLASGLSSSSVGTYAGQVVMQGFIDRRIPLFLRRAMTMAPALVVLAIGLEPTATLVVSQVVLSFGIPFALVPMILLSSRRKVMGTFANRPLTTVVASTVAALIIGLNLFLLHQTFFVDR